MKAKNSILLAISTGIAITSAFATSASKSYQTQYYVRIGPNMHQINGAFLGCAGIKEVCRVKLVSPSGVTITEATTIYINASGTIPTTADVMISGTVIVF